MTEDNREREADSREAGSADVRARLDERARRANERDRVADERDVIADERDQLADERDRVADVRDWQLSQDRSPRPERQRREALKQARRANEREGARIGRLEAGLAREDADRSRAAAKLDYETARGELEPGDPDRTG